MKHPGLDCKLFVWRLSLLELMTELQGGRGGGLTEFLRQNLLSSPSMESVSAPGTLEGEEVTMISWQSSAEEDEEAGPGAVSSVGVRSMSVWTRGGTGQASKLVSSSVSMTQLSEEKERRLLGRWSERSAGSDSMEMKLFGLELTKELDTWEGKDRVESDL